MSTELLRFYEKHLKEAILPFWLKRGLDRQRGGCYTSFDNSGRKLLGTDKFVWSNGRMVWLLAKLAELYPGEPEYLEQAGHGVRFLAEHAFLPNGNCAFLLTEAGELKELIPGGGHDISFYVDCFVVMGFAKYAALAGDAAVLQRALALYDSVLARIDAGNLRTEPYPVPPGYKMHGVPMITLNTGQELAAALRQAGDPAAARVEARTAGFVAEIMRDFAQGDEFLLELVGADGRPRDSVLGTYFNPGHTIEDMWFVMHHALAQADENLFNRAVRLAQNALKRGWDDEFGGLYQYVHKDGGRPRGSKAGLETAAFVEKVENNWECKLWWPHSEALYTFLLGYRVTSDKACLEAHDRVFEYTFRTFPNPDATVGEWIQIRDRQGRPENRVVALPVKDPYHIMRNLLLIIELLSGKRWGSGIQGTGFPSTSRTAPSRVSG